MTIEIIHRCPLSARPCYMVLDYIDVGVHAGKWSSGAKLFDKVQAMRWAAGNENSDTQFPAIVIEATETEVDGLLKKKIYTDSDVDELRMVRRHPTFADIHAVAAQ